MCSPFDHSYMSLTMLEGGRVSSGSNPTPRRVTAIRVGVPAAFAWIQTHGGVVLAPIFLLFCVSVARQHVQTGDTALKGGSGHGLHAPRQPHGDRKHFNHTWAAQVLRQHAGLQENGGVLRFVTCSAVQQQQQAGGGGVVDPHVVYIL